ncbi:MAG: D-glycero-beta-D-manno-heptose-7-phosphate kinase [Rhodospirillales bacterium]
MDDAQDLGQALEKVRGARVVVVGDVMLDRFVHGTVERISPEAPIPVMHVEREDVMLGGAGNVVRNLAGLGARPAFVSVIGDDAAGQQLQALVSEVSGDLGHLLLDRNRANTIKERHVALHQQLLRVDRGTTQPLSTALAYTLVSTVEAHLDEAKVLVLSDYGKGVLGAATTQALIAAARSRGCAVLVDPKGRDFGRYRGASVVTPNRRELAEASGLPTGSDEEVVSAARLIARACGIDAVLATRSEQGMMLYTSEGPRYLEARAREVFDVSGAGDTVVAALAAGLAGGLEVFEAARLANVAAGIVVGKVGTAVTTPDEIMQTLHAQEFMIAGSKILGLNEARAKVHRWRQAGLKIGFTNGCFDLLHPGHVSLLAQAAAKCHRLIVGLNSDDSVGRLKGPRRPVQSEVSRATVLSSLASIDGVVIFEEDTPERLIRALKPDVLVKGADYKVDQVVGADFVQSYGGEVLLAELAPGHSTSSTIARLSAE